MKRVRGVFFDLGDTLIDEQTFMPLDHAEEVLEKLRNKYILAVISNTTTATTDEIERILKVVGLRHYFSFIVASKSFGSNKPDEEIFHFVLDKLSLNPEETVFIGNRIKTDILGANRVRMTSVLLRWNSRHLEESSSPEEEPDFIINSLGELPELLEGLNSSRSSR